MCSPAEALLAWIFSLLTIPGDRYKAKTQEHRKYTVYVWHEAVLSLGLLKSAAGLRHGEAHEGPPGGKDIVLRLGSQWR